MEIVKERIRYLATRSNSEPILGFIVISEATKKSLVQGRLPLLHAVVARRIMRTQWK